MSIVFNLQHLQNYYDHHLHAIYVLVLFDWCHFVWNFPYGFIVHIFVCVNGSTPMSWAKAIVSLIPVPWAVCSLTVVWSASLKKCLHELVRFLFLFVSGCQLIGHTFLQLSWLDQRACVSRPSSNWSRPSLPSIYIAKFGSYTSLVCVTSMKIGMDKPSSL